MKTIWTTLLLSTILLSITTLHTHTLISAHQQTIDLSNHLNISNMNAQNWIYGNLTEQTYLFIRFDIVQKNNVTQCPIETPYVLNGTDICQQCVDPKPVFLLENSTCISIPAGSIVNETTQQFVNGTTSTTNNTTATNNSKTNTSNNVTSNTVEVIIDVTKNGNITNLDAQNWILGNMTWQEYQLIRFNQTSTKNLTQCDITTPYVLNGTTNCQQCPATKPLFVLKNNSCIPCQNGQKWNANTTKCENNTNTTILPTIQTCIDFITCKNGQYYDYEEQKCEYCDFGQYFDNQFLACIYCPDDKPLLDQNHVCVTCPTGEKINRPLHICE